MANFITQDLQKILEKFGDGCTNLSWTLTSEKGQYALYLKWVGARDDSDTGANKILDNSQSAKRHFPKQVSGYIPHQKPAPRHQPQTPVRKHKCPSTLRRDHARRVLWLENKRLSKIDLTDTESETHPESFVYQSVIPVIQTPRVTSVTSEVLEKDITSEPVHIKLTTTSIDSVDTPEPAVDSVDNHSVISVDKPERANIDPENHNTQATSGNEPEVVNEVLEQIQNHTLITAHFRHTRNTSRTTQSFSFRT